MDGRGGERWRRHSGSNRREYHEIRRPRHESNVREQLRWSPSRGRDSGWKNVESRHHRKPTNNGDRRFSGKHGYSYERDPSPASISSSKRPRLADEEGSSGLSVSECTLEVVSQTSGVLPGTGSKMRHERRGGGGGGMPLPVACEENTDFRERPSKNAEEPCRAFLSKLYYSYGEDKVHEYTTISSLKYLGGCVSLCKECGYIWMYMHLDLVTVKMVRYYTPVSTAMRRGSIATPSAVAMVTQVRHGGLPWGVAFVLRSG